MPVSSKTFFSLPKLPDWGPPSFLFHVYHIVGYLRVCGGGRQGFEVHYQHPCRTEFKNGWSYTSVIYHQCYRV